MPSEPTECAAIFVVRDIPTSLTYYRDALGFAVSFTWGEPPTYAGVCRGAVTLHLQAASQTKCPPGAAALSLFVGSADDVHRELARRGARIVKPPASHPYGMRDFDVLDPDGNRLVYGSEDPPRGAHKT